MKISEDQLQAQCVQWFRLQYPANVIYAIPNGGLRNKIVAAKLKRCGVLPGVPDLCIPAYCNVISLKQGQINYYESLGLYIELKVNNNHVTPKQFEVQLKLIELGYAVAICYTFDEFQKVVKDYLGE